MTSYVFHKVELLDARDSLRNKMQGVRCSSAPSVSPLHACQNANILENRKERCVHANLVNQLIRCTQVYTVQSITQQKGDRSDPKGAFAKSCGKFYRSDEYSVLEIYDLKTGSSDTC